MAQRTVKQTEASEANGDCFSLSSKGLSVDRAIEDSPPDQGRCRRRLVWEASTVLLIERQTLVPARHGIAVGGKGKKHSNNV